MEFMLMQYNVENLFDTVDDPNKEDEDFVIYFVPMACIITRSLFLHFKIT